MANLTITVDEDVLRRARIRALERHESVNAYLARTLERYADSGVSARAVFAEIGELADAAQAGSEGTGRTWTRDDLHRE
ncbi:MAG: hypothetical protein ACR2FV_14125 [Ornithinimicrobium sp.]|jgi:hypothetical protein|uniref:hypothetical protein n=1 Tax=Ornithinimicrobium sp. TaxID=1977084 RepID=UPI003D9BCD4B